MTEISTLVRKPGRLFKYFCVICAKYLPIQNENSIIQI